jgi:hypothetical protein
MALQGSGEIRLSQVNVELGRGSSNIHSMQDGQTGVYATINTNSAAKPDGIAPHSMSEWYGYNHTATSPDRFPYSHDIYPLDAASCGGNEGARETRYADFNVLGPGVIMSATPATYTGFTNNVNYTWYYLGDKYWFTLRLISGELTVENFTNCGPSSPPA